MGPLLHWGNFVGIGLAELLWEDRDAEVWVPRIKIWHPQFIQWDWQKRVYRVITEGGIIDLPRTNKDVHSDGHWLVYTPYGYQYGWLQGLVRCLGRLYMGRGWTYRDWFRQSEAHGKPVDMAIVPAAAPIDKKRQFFSQVANRGADTAVLVEHDENGRGYDLKFLEATGRTWEVFEKLLDRVNVDIAVAVLGQNLTTEIQSGSLAAAKVSDRVRADFLRRDAETLTKTLHAQVLHWWALYNFNDAGLAPMPEFEIDPPEDDVQDATTLKLIAESLSVFKSAEAPVDQREILERYNVPQSDVEEEPEPLPPIPGPPPPPAPELDAGDPNQNPDRPMEPQKPSNPQRPQNPQQPEGPAKTVASKIEKRTDGFYVLSEDGEKVLGGPYPTRAEALERLRQVEHYKTHALAAPKIAAPSPRYADRLAARSTSRAVAAVEPTMRAVLRAVRAAKSPDDLRRRIEKLAAGIDPQRLAKVVERAQIMAELAGRSDILDEL
jgi:phage gp29-like protein